MQRFRRFELLFFPRDRVRAANRLPGLFCGAEAKELPAGDFRDKLLNKQISLTLVGTASFAGKSTS
jgi:hypothetical protein